MQSATGNLMHTSVDCAVDNYQPAAARSAHLLTRECPQLPLLWRIPERVGGQVQPRPAAVDELVEVTGQALLEVIVFGAGTDGFLDVGRAVDAERHGSYLPVITLGTVVPALHRSHLARTGVARNRLPVCPLPLRTPRVRAGPRVLPVSCLDRVEDECPLVGGGEPLGFFPLAQPASPGDPGPDRGADVGGEADRADSPGDDRYPDAEGRIHTVGDGAVPQPGRHHLQERK